MEANKKERETEKKRRMIGKNKIKKEYNNNLEGSHQVQPSSKGR